MANNFLKYSHLSFDDIVRQVNDKLSGDPRFANFRESAIAQTFIEIFAGTADLISYYLERRAEECFFDTARLRSSVILLARSLGYSITRPIPAKTTIKVVLTGNCIDKFNDNETIQIPARAVFSYNGNNYILYKTFTFTVTPELNSQMARDGDNFEYEIKADDDNNSILLLQGDMIDKVIEGISNNQVGSKFQFYRIEDKGFSNFYGTDDSVFRGFYKNVSTLEYDKTLTKVWVGDNKSDENEFKIDTKSLLNFISLESFAAGTSSKVCVIRTAIDDNVELLFGDDRFASIGARTINDNIYIQYLSTKGAAANENGVIGKELQYSGSVFNQNGDDITDVIKFKFNSNIVDGADIEDIESIRANAPAIFYSLDRLVSKKDYIAYLKSLTSPIVVKNAIAWAEQEEAYAQNVEAIKALFNIVFFTAVGSLYDPKVNPYLEANYDPDSLNSQSYFNIYTKNDVVSQLNAYNISADTWQMTSEPILTNGDNLPDRAYLATTYGNVATLNFYYTSDNSLYVPTISALSNIVMDFSDLGTIAFATDEDAMKEIASRIETQLRTVKDRRGGDLTNNPNYDQYAFPNVSCSFNINIVNPNPYVNFKVYQFIIRFASTDRCYINAFDNSQLDQDLRFTNAIPSKVRVVGSEVISKNVTDVIGLLDKRGQITLKHVYISPIIHNFNINGTVYISHLFDKEKLKSEIETSIYKWLDINADFNVEIFKSNITQIIEDYNGVKAADITIDPKLPYNPTNSTFFTSSTIQGNYTDAEKNQIFGLILIDLRSWIGINNLTNDNGKYDFTYYLDILQSATFEWNNNITERSFLTEFAKRVYNNSTLSTHYPSFRDSLDFYNVMNAIHKDLIYIIRSNMLDTNGNIATEIRNGEPFKGGYSLGNEIARLYCNMTYTYRN